MIKECVKCHLPNVFCKCDKDYGLQPITIDLVRELRMNGKESQARSLLYQFYENKRKERIQLKKELKRDYLKKYNMLKKRID